MDLQQLCELGQQQLMRMEYLRAERTLAEAERLATEQNDFDTLSRLYMPLQESRRQRRQRCGEGIVRMDLLAEDPNDPIDADQIIEKYPHGQLLIGGWGTIDPALKLRQLQIERELYVETFLAAVYPVGSGRAVVIVPLAEVKLPDPAPRLIDELIKLLPAHSIVLGESELPRGEQKGNTLTFAQTMAMWERLHAPFLAAADMQADPMRKIEAYRRTIDVDYACELAHQNLSETARALVAQENDPMSDYYENPRRGMPLGRLLIAVVIIIAGLLSYYSNTQVNPVTGEKQHIAMSVDQEKALGLQAAPQMAQQMGGAVDPSSDPAAAKVAQIGALIVQKSDAGRSPYSDNFHYHLLNDPNTINAFALPGGQIFITRGLYVRLQNEAQLAGVLGHETGHVINRHAAEQMAKGQLGQMLVAAVGVGASDDRNRGQVAAMAAAMVNDMMQLKYSRTDELEADKYGLMYMTQAGFTPAAMLEVMQILKQAAGAGGGSDIFQTHPDPDARIAQIQAYLKDHPPEASLSQGKPLR